MMDYYLEFLFPEKRVRYIAIAENEDTEKRAVRFRPFQKLVQRVVCKRYEPQGKGRFQSEICRRRAYRRLCPIGYRKHPKIKNKLIIDEETRWIVERIFDLAVHGRGAASITRILIEEKVPTPGYINFRRDKTFANIYADAPEEKKLRMDDSAGQKHFER